MTHFDEINQVAIKNTKRTMEVIPDTMRSFKRLQNEAYKAGALDKKTKEFAALSFAIADKCEACIGNHVSKLIQLGASREEIGEIVSVAIVMGGGPGSVYGAKALEAYDNETQRPPTV